MLIGIDEWLINFEIAQMILMRVVLVDVRAQAPQMLQAEMLEVMAVIIKVIRRILRKILRKRLMRLKP